VLRLGTNHSPEAEDNICPARESIVPSTSDFFIPPYLSHNGHVVPLRHLYPISRDHLLPLVEYNVFRASCTNILILGYSHLFQNSCGFRGSVPVFPNPYQGDNIPVSLRPTPLQQLTIYPDWIDIIPSPRMRDNAIGTLHLFTHSELVADLLGGLVGRPSNINSGLLVWSNPWEPSGWELTEGFIRKWAFLVQGCTDLVQSTNRWRNLRGEEPLTLELKWSVLIWNTLNYMENKWVSLRSRWCKVTSAVVDLARSSLCIHSSNLPCVIRLSTRIPSATPLRKLEKVLGRWVQPFVFSVLRPWLDQAYFLYLFL